jgi:hypothetical protein
MNDFIEEQGPVQGWCDKFFGPTQCQVVSLHVDKPPSAPAQCRLPLGTLPPQVVCWQRVQSAKPLPKSA